MCNNYNECYSHVYSNYLSLYQAVALFITLGATETLTVQQMINRVRVLQQPLYAFPSLSSIVQQISDCQWVQPGHVTRPYSPSGHVTRPHPPPSQSLKQLELFCQWVVFLVEDYIIPLVKVLVDNNLFTVYKYCLELSV